jgi:hypothetical protein
MKYIIITIITALAATCLLFGQGISGSNPGFGFGVPMDPPYDAKKLPQLTLTDAYAMSLERIGTATNRFYCVSASCLEKTKSGWPGWTFSFSNTNGRVAHVEVFFRKATYVDPESAGILDHD